MHTVVGNSDLKTTAAKRSAAGSVLPRVKRSAGDDEAPGAPDRLDAHLRRDRVTRFGLTFLDHFDGIHLKDLVVDSMDDDRRMTVGGRTLHNFGSDSFLGLDRHPAVRQAMIDAAKLWGTHNGASRAFSSVQLSEEAERRLAEWLGVEDTLIYPSVTLANIGLMPAVTRPDDLLVVDRQSHDSIQQAAKIAAANGARLRELHPCHPDPLRELLEAEAHPSAVVAVDGVYSMTGKIPPLAELDRMARSHGGILYVDDAHGTGVVGPGGRGAAMMSLGSLREVLMVGSLSKAFSCMGAFVTCHPELKRVLKIRSSTFIFGGPVPPPYLAAVCAVCEILGSPEHDRLLQRLHSLMERLSEGIRAQGLSVLGGQAPIISVTIGDIERTFEAGKWLFDRGYYVQSATYPAVPINGGLLRIQVNANHSEEDVDGLVGALGELKEAFHLPDAGIRGD
ncbi:MAG: pyridoxal phosphate-dependent aminotransferase family protein [Thermoguttaceae bacterium]|jgi:7-keto-8-aminopelargonate synthetase-like enzyme